MLRHRHAPATPDRNASFLRTALLDAAHSAYAEWLQESFAVEHLYASWNGAAACDRPLAFAAYAAALEREERAAAAYAEIARTAAEHIRGH